MKLSISKKLFFSHSLVLAIFVIISIIALNIGAKIYIEKQTQTNIISVSTAMASIFEEELTGENLATQNVEPIRKTLQRTNQLLKSSSQILNIQYVVLNAKAKIIQLKKDEAMANENLNNGLISKFFDSSGRIKNSDAKININGVDYLANVVKLSMKSGREMGYIVVYSDLAGVRDLRWKINILIMFVFFITGALVAILTVYLSKRISRPILKLTEYADKIAKRDFEAKPDIAENDEIEKLSQSMQNMACSLKNFDENMKKFVDNFSHEIRTPLTSISGYAEAIKFGVVENTEQAADIIIEESNRLKIYVEDLLYLSKLESNSSIYKFEKIDICDLVMDTIDRVSGFALKFQKKISANIPEKSMDVFADGEKLQRALLNVISNCLRYAKTEVNIAVKECLNEKSEKNCVEITITDDGPGFSADVAEKLFDRFTTGEGGKFGLGLSIAKVIIDRHRGKIEAKNSENSGAVFVISISG